MVSLLRGTLKNERGRVNSPLNGTQLVVVLLSSMTFGPPEIPAETTFPSRPCSDLRVPAWDRGALGAAQKQYGAADGPALRGLNGCGPGP